MLPERIPDPSRFPFTLPWVAGFDLALRSAVTLFVGEAGSGKSTALEAIATLCGFPATGGGKNESADRCRLEERSLLAPTLRPW